MKKVGIAFGDFVTEERMNRRRGGGSGAIGEILGVFPLFVLGIAFSFLFARLFYIQIIRGDYYKKLSDSNRTLTKILPAPRGIIFDHTGKKLVSNSPAFFILDKGVVKNLDENEALSRLSLGVPVENEIKREYLYKDAAAHVLGYVGKVSSEEVNLPAFEDYETTDDAGKTGLEKEYETVLHGKNGRELFEVDSKGKIVKKLGRQDPTDGKNITTTLDLTIQLAAYNAMKNVKKGVVVVSDPRDGGIRALFSKPSFDPNIFIRSKNYEGIGDYKTRESILLDSENNPLLNRAIGGVYPPGSTFKLVTAIASLEKGAINPSTKITDTGILKVGDFSFGNWYFLQYGKTDGEIDIVGAIKRSNDIFFYKAAEGAGVDFISSWAKNLGLGERLGIDLQGEVAGTVPTPEWKEKTLGEQWYLGDTYNYGIGQGYLLTTPLQVNFWTSVFANDGTLYRPHLIDGKKETIKKNFLKKEYVDLVREGMRQSCDAGGVAWPFFQFKVENSKLKVDGIDYVDASSGSAKMVQIKLGCKTGTAEIGGKETKPHAWITVFAPFYHPEVVVTVLVENGGEGSSFAGPIAKEILTKYFEAK